MPRKAPPAEVADTDTITEPGALLTAPQAAKVLSVSVNTLNIWRMGRRGPKYQRLNGRAIRYRLYDLHEYIEQSTVAPAVTV